MSEDVSRRKMLSLLGLGATLGFTLSGVLEPLVAEAQEAAPATPPIPNPTAPATGSAAPAQATGTRGRKRHSPSATGRAPRSPCCTRRCASSCSSSAISDPRWVAPNKKDEGSLCLPRPSVFEKHGAYCISFRESARYPRGWDSRATIERFVLTLAGPKTKLMLDD